jgi:hypothetical protein
MYVDHLSICQTGKTAVRPQTVGVGAGWRLVCTCTSAVEHVAHDMMANPGKVRLLAMSSYFFLILGKLD